MERNASVSRFRTLRSAPTLKTLRLSKGHVSELPIKIQAFTFNIFQEIQILNPAPVGRDDEGCFQKVCTEEVADWH